MKWFCLALAVAACQNDDPPAPAKPEPLPAPPIRASQEPRPAEPKRDFTRYPWLGEAGVPEAVGSLRERFEPPPGFTRLKLEAGSFGEWLSGLPMTAPGTPVRTWRGDILLPADDQRIAGVVALDIGKADLQQCADAVIRLHAEWSWMRGERNVSYRAASGLDLPFERWARGERIRVQGASIAWAQGGRPVAHHAGFRKYLDTVFAWANTVSLAKQAKSVKEVDVRPGDFFVLPGNPGHTVLVLDMAVSKKRRVALLGQSYMPAQSFQVLRPRAGGVWYELDPEQDVATPFWRPFPWSSLHRLD